jgi:hypothetical protein
VRSSHGRSRRFNPCCAHPAPGLAGLLLALTLPGCFKATFEDARSPEPAETSVAYRSYYLVGVVGSGEVDVRDYCRSGRARRVRTESNFGTMVISVLTLGIYTPRVVTITCAREEQP